MRVAGQSHTPTALHQGNRSVTHRPEGRVDPRTGMDKTDFKNDTFSSDYRGPFLKVKQAEREVDHSSSSTTEVKNEWDDTSTPSIRLRGMDSESFTCIPIWNT